VIANGRREYSVAGEDDEREQHERRAQLLGFSTLIKMAEVITSIAERARVSGDPPRTLK